MSLLVGNQLPVALARYFSANGWECCHVLDVGLDAVSDGIIWQYAKERDMIIITKDEVFRFLQIAMAVFHRKLSGFASAIVVKRHCSIHFPEFHLRYETC